MTDVRPSLIMRHGAFWMSDPQYRAAWIVGPQIAALLAVGLIIANGRQAAPVTEPAPWFHGPTISNEAQSLIELRNRARTNVVEAAALEAKANSGNAVAQFMMATLNDPSLLGPMATLDKTSKALDWYRRAADQGLAVAAFNLGNLLIHGRFDIPINYSEGTRFLEKASPSFPPAQRELGLMIRDGRGSPADPSKGMQLVRTAAERGDPVAARIYAQDLEQGTHGLAANHEEAQRWFRRAQLETLSTNHR